MSHSYTPLLLLFLLLTLLLIPPCTPQPTTPTAPTENNNNNDEAEQKRNFFILHLIGVFCGAVASATRTYYAPYCFLDALCTLLFYLMASVIFSIAVYVTYDFQSADMLLIGVAAGVVVIGAQFPRWWSFRARVGHWNGAMWRQKDGMMIRRTRRRRTRGGRTGVWWNGPEYRAWLLGGVESREVVEADPRHWERVTVFWQAFVSRGRIGDEQTRRAAMALRMAYTVPLPVYVKCGKSEYFAIRGALGMEVLNTWMSYGLKDVLECPLFQNKGKRQWQLCDDRMLLVYYLHVTLSLHQSRELERRNLDNGRDAVRSNWVQEWVQGWKRDKNDWMSFALDWLDGELCAKPAQTEDSTVSARETTHGDRPTGDTAGQGAEVGMAPDWKNEVANAVACGEFLDKEGKGVQWFMLRGSDPSVTDWRKMQAGEEAV